jgi:hypothetical protein
MPRPGRCGVARRAHRCRAARCHRGAAGPGGWSVAGRSRAGREVGPRGPGPDSERTVMSTIHAGGTDAARDPRTAFAELGKIMLGEQQLSETLGKVAELAKQTLPGAAEVSVTLMQDSDGGSVWSRAGANHRQAGEPPAEGCRRLRRRAWRTAARCPRCRTAGRWHPRRRGQRFLTTVSTTSPGCSGTGPGSPASGDEDDKSPVTEDRHAGICGSRGLQCPRLPDPGEGPRPVRPKPLGVPVAES